jgi:hypothetical protein
MQVSWSEFKKVLDGTKCSFICVKDHAEVNYFLSMGKLECSLPIGVSNIDTEQFETYYLIKANKQTHDDNGSMIYAPTLQYDLDLTAIWKGYTYSASANAQSFFDERVTTEIKMRGGWYEVLTDQASLGDYIEFSIIDKDDVLGYFQYFGLTVGVDILELKKFVRTNYIKPGSASKREYAAASASDVVEGLYFRTTYYNAGNNAVPFSIVVHYLEG